MVSEVLVQSVNPTAFGLVEKQRHDAEKPVAGPPTASLMEARSTESKKDTVH